MNQKDMFSSALWVTGERSEAKKSKIYILRGKFDIKTVKKATLRVLGLGCFHCYINGARVSNDLFLPLNTDFEPRENFPPQEIVSGHRMYVPEYDITHLLQNGENVIAIHFGGGWYTYEDEAKFGNAKAIWYIFGEDENGAFDFGSSENDRIGESFVTDYHLTKTEVHDYTSENASATDADFNDGDWSCAVSARPPQTDYQFSDCPADKVCDTLPIRKVSEANGYTVYDCGKNTSGYPLIKLSGNEGEAVDIIFAEELDQNGAVRMTYSHNQTARFICGGQEKTVHPLFTWFGFRYFALRGPAVPLQVEVVHTAVEVAASFVSDNPLLNWMHDAYVNTQLTNMHAGIPSDCPHIERRGYTGDGQLTCHAVMNILNSKAFYRKWIADICDCQDTLSGHVQYTAPYTHSGGGPGGWGCAIVEVPYQFYLHYGDKSVLSECYPYMLRYFDYLEAHSYQNLVVSDKEGEWCLGDWCPPMQVVLPAPFINNYFYIKALGRCIEIAKIIEKEEDIPAFENRIKDRKEATVAAYFNSWDGNFIGNLQGANAFAVDIGLGDERTYKNLVAYYEKTQSYDTGIFGTDVVTRVLFEHGDGPLAVKLLLSESTHSFAEMRKRGATTLWEYWPESLEDRSHNHPMFGAVAAYFYDYLLGIRAESCSAAYEKLEIAPVITEEIQTLSGHRTLPKGKAALSYTRKDGEISFTVEIPEGQEAVFRFGKNTLPLHPGVNRFSF